MGKWSVAWRVHDAQFWGVAQRRKRISLIADFAGLSAPEICFERKGLLWNPKKGGEERKEAAGTIGKSTPGTISFQERAGKPGGGKGILIQDEHVGALSTVNNQSVFCLQGGGETSKNSHGSGINKDVSFTLNALDRHAVACSSPIICLNDQGGSVINHSVDVTGALRAEEHGHQPIVVEMTSTKNTVVENGISPTLTARMGTGGNQVNAVCMDVGFFDSHEEKTPTLLARQYKDPPLVCGIADRGEYKEGIAPLRQSGGDVGGGSENLCVETYQNVTGSLMASGYEKLGTQEAANDMYITGNFVRRLTPTECERLQGFPDGWTDIGEWTDSKGKVHKDSDSPRYKALGNSIALPFWQYLARRICAQYERNITIGSLFDGIGGFPLVFQRCGATPVWASEIEEFPIAVTKKRFPEG